MSNGAVRCLISIVSRSTRDRIGSRAAMHVTPDWKASVCATECPLQTTVSYVGREHRRRFSDLLLETAEGATDAHILTGEEKGTRKT